MTNLCQFSPCRQYRYTLLHGAEEITESTICWIGLNPSTADEQQLDPTLRRIKAFTEREGFGSFCMLNAFAFRATDPKVMQRHYAALSYAERDRELWMNAAHIRNSINATRHRTVVCAWGGNTEVLPEWLEFLTEDKRIKPLCLGTTTAGHPRHPLYLPADAKLVEFTGKATE